MVEAILAARAELNVQGWDDGALSIYYWMLAAGQSPPAARTVHRVLVRQGLITPQPKKRRRSSYRRFQFPATDDCWQIDAFEYQLADATVVVIFELKDDCSRYLLEERAWPREDTLGAWTCLAAAISRYGRPRLLLSDNSLAFTGHHRHLVVLFEQNLIRLGIKPVHSSPSHPQTCGKSERGHQTAQRWLRRRRPAATLDELQTLLDQYRDAFNHRPHQALDGSTPARERDARRRLTAHPELTTTYPTQVSTPTANRNGAIRVARTVIPLGAEHAGQPTIVFTTNDHVLVFHHHHLVRELTLDRSRQYQPLPVDDTGRRRRPTRPHLTPPGFLHNQPNPPERSRGQGGAPHRKNDLDRGEHRQTMNTRRNQVSAMS
jgi:hypothetical protein